MSPDINIISCRTSNGIILVKHNLKINYTYSSSLLLYLYFFFEWQYKFRSSLDLCTLFVQIMFKQVNFNNSNNLLYLGVPVL